ncbi:hypothetical protein ACFXDJ_14940 [Streptomyces sp. NPDC059443]|uniref:hypothetical protein n=1 Tax=unclassified Streptomyces TaxID=2593676 RepID=UPI0036B16374
MDEDGWLLRYGLHPDEHGLGEARTLLVEESRLEREVQGQGDTSLMKLCCVQLFHAGVLDDALLIWRAKTASWDADCSIDIQLLCGGGLNQTKTWLASQQSEESQSALRRLLRCEEAGDFDGFSPGERFAAYVAYYA